MDARRAGALAVLPALEGADGLEGRLHLHALHEKGLRLLQLVHFRANELGHIQTYPYSVLAAGRTDEEVGQAMGGNFMRVWQRVEEVAGQ